MVEKVYIPSARDIVWVDLNPTKGREQAKRRPALVISPKSYNKKTGLALMCPIASQVKGYPFEVVVTSKEVMGVVLSDHVRSLDWRVRNVRLIARLSPTAMSEVKAKLTLLISE